MQVVGWILFLLLGGACFLVAQRGQFATDEKVAKLELQVRNRETKIARFKANQQAEIVALEAKLTRAKFETADYEAKRKVLEDKKDQLNEGVAEKIAERETRREAEVEAALTREDNAEPEEDLPTKLSRLTEEEKTLRQVFKSFQR